jgi:hypothetical protein
MARGVTLAIMVSCPAKELCRQLGKRAGCAGALWLMLKLSFMILRVIPHTGGILRGAAATDSGARARSSGEARPDTQAGWRLDGMYLVVGT